MKTTNAINNEVLALNITLRTLKTLILGLCYRHTIETGHTNEQITEAFVQASNLNLTPPNTTELLTNALTLIESAENINALETINNYNEQLLSEILKLTHSQIDNATKETLHTLLSTQTKPNALPYV